MNILPGDLTVILILFLAFMLTVFYDLFKQKWGNWWVSSLPKNFKMTFVDSKENKALLPNEGVVQADPKPHVFVTEGGMTNEHSKFSRRRKFSLPAIRRRKTKTHHD